MKRIQGNMQAIGETTLSGVPFDSLVRENADDDGLVGYGSQHRGIDMVRFPKVCRGRKGHGMHIEKH